MLLSDLDFQYPPELIAQEPQRPTRVALKSKSALPQEITLEQLIDNHFQTGDLLVLNDTKVIPARLFTEDQTEILFLKAQNPLKWEVLFPAREYKVGAKLKLPAGVIATLEQKGLPQTLSLNQELSLDYFENHGEMALPPYIQEARGERHERPADRALYQTAWADPPGSVAAPTASLHFTDEHLKRIEARGGQIAKVTLHVGAGTFLPVRTQDLRNHDMHSETVAISNKTIAQIAMCRKAQKKVWALGTTAARTLESMDLLPKKPNGAIEGETKLFIYPPYQFKTVDVLLTNFHQPRSTLLALVSAFAGEQEVKQTYQWAIEQRFKLFSYGDLSAWM